MAIPFTLPMGWQNSPPPYYVRPRKRKRILQTNPSVPTIQADLIS